MRKWANSGCLPTFTLGRLGGSGPMKTQEEKHVLGGKMVLILEVLTLICLWDIQVYMPHKPFDI